MSPLIHNLPRSAARVVALSALQHAPDERFIRWVFDGLDVGADEDEVIEVTFSRRVKPPTLPVFKAVVAEVEMVG